MSSVMKVFYGGDLSNIYKSPNTIINQDDISQQTADSQALSPVSGSATDIAAGFEKVSPIQTPRDVSLHHRPGSSTGSRGRISEDTSEDEPPPTSLVLKVSSFFQPITQCKHD